MSAEVPNVVWIVSEDCPPWLGAYGDRLARTPRIDALARRGITYRNAFCPAPVCAPARFGLLTGQYAVAHVGANNMRAAARLPGRFRTYPELMRGLGYYCTNNAKTDYNADVDPAELWDESSRRAHWRRRPPGTPFLSVFNLDMTHESALFGLQGRAPRVVAPEGIELPPYLPDTPELRSDFACYYGFIHRMDRALGALLNQLDEDGLTENTVIIYTSDHGGVLPRSKRYCYDEGLHVPLIIVPTARLRDRLPPVGTAVETPVSTLSIPPTLIDIAGGAVPDHMHEASLLDRAHTDTDLVFGARDRVDERFDTVRTIRSRRFRYIRNYTPHRPAVQNQAFALVAAGFRSWEEQHLQRRLDPASERMWQNKPPIELYDIEADPYELHNRAGQPEYRHVQAELAVALANVMRSVEDHGFVAETASPRAVTTLQLARALAIADAGLAADPAHADPAHADPAHVDPAHVDLAQLDELLAAVEDDDATMRRWAVLGVSRLADAPTAAEVRDRVVPVLRGRLADAESCVSIPAAEALIRLGDAHVAATHLATKLGARDPLVRLEALNAFTFVDIAWARRYRSQVARTARDADEYVRSAGAYLTRLIDGTYTTRRPLYSIRRMIGQHLLGLVKARLRRPVARRFG